MNWRWGTVPSRGPRFLPSRIKQRQRGKDKARGTQSLPSGLEKNKGDCPFDSHRERLVP